MPVPGRIPGHRPAARRRVGCTVREGQRPETGCRLRGGAGSRWSASGRRGPNIGRSNMNGRRIRRLRVRLLFSGSPRFH